jgi:hypothetical protein
MNWKIGLALGLVAVAVVVAGCVYGPKRVAYNTLAGTEITVDTAMQAWGAYVQQVHPPAQQEKQVADAYANYQLAEEAAIDATHAVISGTGTSAQQSQATAQAATALNELVGLLRQFGVKI